jgi:uncharacterized membrane protein
MKIYAKRYELKNKAKDNLGGKYGSAVLVSFLGMLIPSIIRMIITANFSPSLPYTHPVPYYTFSVLLSLVLSSILGVFNIGIAFFFLKMACGQSYSVKDLFFGFRNDSGKALILSGISALVNAVCLYPYQYLLDYFLLVREEIWLYRTAAALLIGLCVYIPVALNLALIYYLALDFPEKTVSEILSLSVRLMKGQKKRLFFLELSFLPMMLLCVCSLYIGFLWLQPYMYMTEACFYLDLMNPRMAQKG